MTVAGHRLTYEWIGPAPEDAPTLVFLHEGLGSVRQWRDFPSIVAADTGCGALVYNRWGHGDSDPIDRPRRASFMHEEAFESLPVLLAELAVRRPVLVGHSDGGSIALIAAGSGVVRAEALVLEAPHVFVEQFGVDRIALAKAQYETTNLKGRLERYHGANTDTMFRNWCNVWLSDEFQSWNIESYLPGVTCPVLAIQGCGDEYGTLEQIESISTHVTGPVETLILRDCGHAPHAERRAEAAEAIGRFIRKWVTSPRQAAVDGRNS